MSQALEAEGFAATERFDHLKDENLKLKGENWDLRQEVKHLKGMIGLVTHEANQALRNPLTVELFHRKQHADTTSPQHDHHGSVPEDQQRDLFDERATTYGKIPSYQHAENWVRYLSTQFPFIDG